PVPTPAPVSFPAVPPDSPVSAPVFPAPVSAPAVAPDSPVSAPVFPAPVSAPAVAPDSPVSAPVLPAPVSLPAVAPDSPVSAPVLPAPVSLPAVAPELPVSTPVPLVWFVLLPESPALSPVAALLSAPAVAPDSPVSAAVVGGGGVPFPVPEALPGVLPEPESPPSSSGPAFLPGENWMTSFAALFLLSAAGSAGDVLGSDGGGTGFELVLIVTMSGEPA